MKTVTIDVTQEDIDSGEPLSCNSCPIALAAERAGFADVSVGGYLWFVNTDGLRLRASIPPVALEFIGDFDNEETVVPFSFSVEIPE
jgi:hypothetical protein